MKKITKLTCTFAVMAAALFALTGCSNPDPPLKPANRLSLTLSQTQQTPNQ